MRRIRSTWLWLNRTKRWLAGTMSLIVALLLLDYLVRLGMTPGTGDSIGAGLADVARFLLRGGR